MIIDPSIYPSIYNISQIIDPHRVCYPSPTRCFILKCLGVSIIDILNLKEIFRNHQSDPTILQLKWLTIKPKVSLTWYKKVTGCNFY